MSDGLFDSVIKICTIGLFVLFSLLGIGFALLSIFKIFSKFLNKIAINSTANINCNEKKSENRISKKLKRDKSSEKIKKANVTAT